MLELFLRGGSKMHNEKVKTNYYKHSIPSLSYNAMFKAVISNNPILLHKIVEAIIEYFQLNVDIKDKELSVKINELPLNNYKEKQLVVDYIIKLDETTDLNIEINKSFYAGLKERNMTYSFKIFYEHYKSGDNKEDFKKYTLIQVNFNNYSNTNNKVINHFLLIDVDDITNTYSNNFRIINIDIVSCYNLVYNNTNNNEISKLERLSAMIYCNNLEDISKVLGSDIFTMEEKKNLLDSIEKIGQDDKILQATKLEDSIEDRYRIIAGYARDEGVEKTTLDIIKNMLKNNSEYEFISKITGKSIEEIKKIEASN
jgi:hypothetical protein